MGELAFRALLIAFGFACVGTEVFGTYEFLWEKYQHWNYLVVGGLIVTSLAAILPMAAEFARRKGMHGLKLAAWVSVPIALVFVFTAAIQRTGAVIDQDEAGRSNQAAAIAIAKQEANEAEAQLKTDQATVAKNCDVWGSICTKAKAAQEKTERKLSDARAALKKQSTVIDDSMAKRIVAYLPFITKEQVQLYHPMLLPLTLAIMGSVCIAIGVRGGEPAPRTPSLWSRLRVQRKTPPRAAMPASIEQLPIEVAITEATATNTPSQSPEAVELDPAPVVAFLKRALPAAKGALADLGDIYAGFLADWERQGFKGAPLTPAQFGHVLRYICDEAGIRIARRANRVVCVDRRLLIADRQQPIAH